jgi:GTP-binding protein
VGKTPGATASVNLYALLAKDKRAGGSGNSQKPLLGFVDLPGFGFAKLSKDLKQSVEVAAERYLNKRSKKELALCILLVDIRRVPSEEDRAVLAALYDLGAPLLVVATKIDKLTSNELSASLEVVRSGLGLPEGQPFHVSSSTGTGIRELWSIILDACEDRVNEIRGSLENGGRVSIGDAEEDIGDTVPLDEEGNFVDENDEMEGYEWIQKYGSSFDEKKTKTQSVRDEGRTSFRLKDWKQRAKDMVSRGEI